MAKAKSKKNLRANSKGKTVRKNAKNVARGKRNKAGIKKASRKAHTRTAKKARAETRALKPGQKGKLVRVEKSTGRKYIIAKNAAGLTYKVYKDKGGKKKGGMMDKLKNLVGLGKKKTAKKGGAKKGGKKMSAADRKAFGEKMKSARAAKKAPASPKGPLLLPAPANNDGAGI